MLKTIRVNGRDVVFRRFKIRYDQDAFAGWTFFPANPHDLGADALSVFPKDEEYSLPPFDRNEYDTPDSVEYYIDPDDPSDSFCVMIFKDGFRSLGAVELRNPAEKTTSRLNLSEALLLKIALECPDLDSKTRKGPSHWQVFRAASKDGMSAYEMERRYGWKRRTADERLRTVEQRFLGGAKVSETLIDPAILRNVEAQLKAAHDSHAQKLYRRDLLSNTDGTEDKEN